jgi:hypothetical protein
MNKNYNIELLPEDIIKTMRSNIYHNYLYFKSYTDINQEYLSIRNPLFSLIHKIAKKMNFKSNTYFLSIYFLDLIILKSNIPSKYNNNFELLGLTTLVLAAKHLENDPSVPHLQYFVSAYNYVISQSHYYDTQSTNIDDYPKITFNDLKMSEVIIIKILNYKLNYFTIYDFNAFFFGHGILKIEQLKDINDNFYSGNIDNILDKNLNGEGDLDNIDPAMVKRILEKIYKKSRFYLDKIVKSKICLKYDSFLISSYIMNKSVEYVILKENKIIGTKKKFDKDYMDKKEENLKRKNAKYFREIMNDIYKIDLESIEEYQDLINDTDFLKIFEQSQYDNINKNLLQKNNEDEYNIKERLDRFHHKVKTSIFENIEKSNEKEAKTKEFSPKKVSKMKVPSEKYNKIRKLKIMEDNKNTNISKNKLAKSYLKIKMNDDISLKINRTIKLKENKKTILEKSNYNMDLSDINNNKNKIQNKPKILSKFHSYYKLIEPYKIKSSKKQTHNNNNNPKRRNSNKKDLKKIENNLFYFQTINVEREANTSRNNVDNPNINTISIKSEKHTIKKTEVKPNKSQTINIKPYSRKVIPKAEKRESNNVNSYEKRNVNKRYKNIGLNMSNSPKNETEIYKKNKFSDFNLGFKNENKNNLESNINKTIEIKKKEKKGSISINSINDLGNLNIVKKIKENDNFNFGKKIREIPLLNSNYKKLSMSVNKIKVKGVSNKHKLNKRLLFGVHKTPMKTNINANNALRRHIGVKRNNNNNASPDIKNSLNNSIEDKSKMNVIENNISNNKQEKSNNKEYSCINMSQRENSALNKNNKENINMSDKKLIDLKNNIVIDKCTTKSKKNKLIEKDENSSSNKEEGENDEDENENKKNDIKIIVKPTGDGVEQVLDEIARNKDKYKKVKRYKIKKMFDNNDKEKSQSEKKNLKIELIQINKRRSPTIVINNNINVNFDNKSIGVSSTLSKIQKI